jgi:cytochrome P450
MTARADRPDRWLGRRRLALRAGRAVRRRDAGGVLRAVARGHQRATGITLRDQRILLLLDPALVGELLQDHAAITVKGPGVQRTRALLGEGLLSSEGEDHRRVRRLVAPAFSSRRLSGYVTDFGSAARTMSDGWHDGLELDVHRAMGALTLDIVGRTLLGVDLGEQASQIRGTLESALAEFGRVTGGGSLLASAPAVGEVLPGPLAEAFAAVHAVVDRIIDERAAALSPDRGDVVSALLAARADGLTDVEVHDNTMTLVMAGHETTANALSWTFDLLSRHPEVDRALADELAALGGRAPTWDELPGLTYTRAVLTEAMRLYPPAWVMGRSLTQAADIGGWHLRPGDVVAVSPLLLHHDARWYPAPEVFDPSRWLDERRDSVPKHAYLPFGTGPRSCIGEQFAWAEATTVLAVLAARWRLVGRPGHVVVPQYAVTMRPGNGVPAQVRARQPEPA